MQIDKIKNLGGIGHIGWNGGWGYPGLYAIRVIGEGGYQAEFFVLAENRKEVEVRWRKYGRKMRPEIGESIFD